jgi:hypothetical protein
MDHIAKMLLIAVYAGGWLGAAGAAYDAAEPSTSEWIKVPGSMAIATIWPFIYSISAVHEQLTPNEPKTKTAK